jgi:hypothetical protein
MDLAAPDRIAHWLRIAAVAVAVLGAVFLGVAAVMDEPPALTAKSLAASVEGKTGSSAVLDSGTCSRRSTTAWLCEVPDTSGSGTASYSLTVTSERCWRAQRVGGHPASMSDTASGCVH